MSTQSTADSRYSGITHQYTNPKTFEQNKFTYSSQFPEIEMSNLKSTYNHSITNSDKYIPYKKEETALISHTISDMPIEKDISLSQNEQFTYNKNLKGSLFLCCYDKHGNPHICIGPHWPYTLCLFSLISIICFFYFYGLWNIMHVYIRNAGLLITFIQVGSYILTFLKNPGIPGKELWLENFKGENISEYRICNICKVIMRIEDKTEHCDECNICVVGMDHHCPWASKCIGKGNVVCFYVFVISTFVLLVYLVFAVFTLAFTVDR